MPSPGMHAPLKDYLYREMKKKKSLILKTSILLHSSQGVKYNDYS